MFNIGVAKLPESLSTSLVSASVCKIMIILLLVKQIGCQLGERYSGLASVWHNIHLLCSDTADAANVFAFYVNARYKFFWIAFIYVKSLHSTGKKR